MRHTQSLVDIISNPSPDGEEVRHILRQVIHQIELTPQSDDSGYDLVIRGDLAALLAREECSTLMVGAGVGFEPTTFRL